MLCLELPVLKGMLLLPLLLLASCNNSNDSLESLQRRGTDYANDGRLEEAIEVFSTILNRDPTNAPALCARGAIFGELGKYDEALRDLAAAIPNPVAFQNRAVVYSKMQRYEDAIADSMRLLSTQPESAGAYALMASCYAALSDFERAATNYKKVSEMEPENAMAFINYGGTLLKLEQYEKANQVLSQAIRLAPEDYSGWALRYKARGLAGDLEGAEDDRRMARKLNPKWGANTEPSHTGDEHYRAAAGKVFDIMVAEMDLNTTRKYANLLPNTTQEEQQEFAERLLGVLRSEEYRRDYCVILMEMFSAEECERLCELLSDPVLRKYQQRKVDLFTRMIPLAEKYEKYLGDDASVE
jgi:tetratricopeptide (TPR) repeat protein